MRGAPRPTTDTEGGHGNSAHAVGRLGVGLVLVAAYLATGVMTLRISGHDVRPLFDSITSNEPRYQYVCPPPELRVGNIVASADRTTITLGPNGSAASTPATSDGQMVVSLVRAELPAHDADTSVVAILTPLCAARILAVPPGLVAAGNAYRLELVYEPSGVAAKVEDKPGNVVIQPPTTADALLFSADGTHAWTELASFPSGKRLAASLGQPGIYLAVRRGSGTSGPFTSRSGSSLAAILVGAGAGAGAAEP